MLGCSLRNELCSCSKKVTAPVWPLDLYNLWFVTLRLVDLRTVTVVDSYTARRCGAVAVVVVVEFNRWWVRAQQHRRVSAFTAAATACIDPAAPISIILGAEYVTSWPSVGRSPTRAPGPVPFSWGTRGPYLGRSLNWRVRSTLLRVNLRPMRSLFEQGKILKVFSWLFPYL